MDYGEHHLQRELAYSVIGTYEGIPRRRAMEPN